MSYQKERDEFLVRAARLGLDTDTARLILRDAATIQRWAEEECNGTIQRDETDGDKPYRYWNTDHPTLQPTRSRRPIRDSEGFAIARITKRLAPLHLRPWYQGDPRGYCVSIHRADTADADIDCGRVRGLGVPVRG